MSTSLCSIAEEYFNSINQLARRISADIQVKKEAYEEVWKCLSRKEQRQVMDETIIHPEAVLKYAAYPQDNPDYEYFPKLRLQTGEKYIVDEEGGKGVSLSWRDEHSAPFSWMTQSQLNLNVFCNKTGNAEIGQPTKSKPKPSPPKRAPKPVEIFEPPSIVLGGSSVKTTSNKSKSPNEKDANKSVVQEENFLSKLRSKTAVLKLPPKGKTSKSSKGESESLVRPGGSCAIKIKPKTVIAKPKTPPPPPPPKPRKENRPSETKEADRESIGTWEEPANHGAHEEEMALLTRVKEDELVKKNENVSQEVKAKVEPYPVIEEKVSDAPTLVPSDSTDLLATFNVNLKDASQDIPKTGFEFLDNW